MFRFKLAYCLTIRAERGDQIKVTQEDLAFHKVQSPSEDSLCRYSITSTHAFNLPLIRRFLGGVFGHRSKAEKCQTWWPTAYNHDWETERGFRSSDAQAFISVPSVSCRSFGVVFCFHPSLANESDAMCNATRNASRPAVHHCPAALAQLMTLLGYR